jgi:general stress protein YciG
MPGSPTPGATARPLRKDEDECLADARTGEAAETAGARLGVLPMQWHSATGPSTSALQRACHSERLWVHVQRAQALQGEAALKGRNHDMTTPTGSDRPKSNRGFASMDASRQREIASKGGKAAHARGLAHEFTADEARNAGRKGGEIVSRDRDHMVAIGRVGGLARASHRES